MTLDSDPPEPPKWLSERAREEIEHVEPPAAWALSFFFGGGGQLLVRDYRTGVALILADILAIATLPALSGFLTWLAIGTVSSIFAVRQAWALNRHTTARILRQQALSPLSPPLAALDAGTRTTAERPAAALGERAERLSKLADLRRAGVLSAVEHRERKVEILAELGEVVLTHREDLLHDLLRLRARGVVDDDDLQFVKDLGA